MSMSSEEDDRQAAETNRIGAEGNRIGAETDRVAAATARDAADKKVKDHRFRKDVGQLFAYVLIVVVAGAGFWQIDAANDRICSTAGENRTAIRNLVTAVELLGRSLIVEGKPESEWTPDEASAMANLAEFTKSQAGLLDAPVC